MPEPAPVIQATCPCSLPLTGYGCIRKVLTDLAYLEIEDGSFILRERAPGVSVEEIRANSALAVTSRAERLPVPCTGQHAHATRHGKRHCAHARHGLLLRGGGARALEGLRWWRPITGHAELVSDGALPTARGRSPWVCRHIGPNPRGKVVIKAAEGPGRSWVSRASGDWRSASDTHSVTRLSSPTTRTATCTNDSAGGLSAAS